MENSPQDPFHDSHKSNYPTNTRNTLLLEDSSDTKQFAKTARYQTSPLFPETIENRNVLTTFYVMALALSRARSRLISNKTHQVSFVYCRFFFCRFVCSVTQKKENVFNVDLSLMISFVCGGPVMKCDVGVSSGVRATI